MNILSAYLETRARVDEMSADYLYMFTRSKTLSNCEVTNLLTYTSCPAVSGGIDTYSEHFLTGEVLWYYGSGGKLWRINDNRKNEKWQVINGMYLPGQGSVAYTYDYKSGATTWGTVIIMSGGQKLLLIASEGDKGETIFQQVSGEFPPYPQTLFTPETNIDVEGIGDHGKYLTSPFAPSGATANLLVTDYLYAAEKYYEYGNANIPIENINVVQTYALDDFLGLDEDEEGGVGDRYPNRFLLSYNCQSETKMYIPVNRENFKGWQNLVAEGKLFQSGDNGLVGIGAGAVVDGHMTEVMATSGATSWTDLICDITSLPYVDYIILYGRDGAQALRQISVNKSYYGTEEEY